MLGILFWVILVVAVIFGGYSYANPTWTGARFGGWVTIILLAILGYATFGLHLTK